MDIKIIYIILYIYIIYILYILYIIYNIYIYIYILYVYIHITYTVCSHITCEDRNLNNDIPTVRNQDLQRSAVAGGCKCGLPMEMQT